ncbi:la-related protein 1A-like [Salvia splendens]|uniref:la-related protein 1A-like n=1 Tax=Salvia splendens TaxID=180675 RepID=UPI001C26653C|nr:la-related protein 1A-like [Salvia splendens]
MTPPPPSSHQPPFFTPNYTFNYYYPPMGFLQPPSSFFIYTTTTTTTTTTNYSYYPSLGCLQPSSSCVPPPFLPSSSSSSSVVRPPSPPFVPSASPILSLLRETQELRNNILNQIEYYFSDDNLAKDVHLKQYMDDNGWVPIILIGSFPRVAELTQDIGLILFTLISSSQTVEVEGRKVRRRITWNKWLLDATMRMQQRWADDL